MKKTPVLIAVVVAAAAVVSLTTFYLPKTATSGQHSSSGTKPSDPRFVDNTADVLSADDRAKLVEALSANFTDPSSLQIRKVARSSIEGIVCGEVNAKNKMGGYVGYVPFNVNMKPERPSIVLPRRDVFESSPDTYLNIDRALGCNV